MDTISSRTPSIDRLEAELRAVRAENASLRQREAALTGELTEAQVRQAATTEILRVIDSTPPDAQSVFQSVASAAVRLCGAAFAGVHLFDGKLITLDAQHDIQPDALDLLRRQVFPLPPERHSAVGRAVHDRAPVHIHDIRSDPNYRIPVLQSTSGFWTVLAIPMLRDGVPIGAISVWRHDVQPYSDEQIRLVERFADRALAARRRPRSTADRTTLDALLSERRLREITAAGGAGAVDELLQAAEVHARQEKLAWELARILEVRASVSVRAGRRDDGTLGPLLEEALALYEHLDERIEATLLRVRLLARPPSGRRAALPASLTRREAEVLRLVAVGLSNREIAETLTLSEKTVEHHLSNSYGKIGAENRAAAAAFAVRAGLA